MCEPVCVFALKRAHEAHTVFRALSYSLTRSLAHSATTSMARVGMKNLFVARWKKRLAEWYVSIYCCSFLCCAAQHSTVPHRTRALFLFHSQICAQPVFFMLMKYTFVRLAYIFLFYAAAVAAFLAILTCSKCYAAHCTHFFSPCIRSYLRVYGFLLNGWLGCAHGRKWVESRKLWLCWSMKCTINRINLAAVHDGCVFLWF